MRALWLDIRLCTIKKHPASCLQNTIYVIVRMFNMDRLLYKTGWPLRNVLYTACPGITDPSVYAL